MNDWPPLRVLSSVVLVLVLPVLFGPLLVSLAHIGLYVAEHVLDIPRQEPRTPEDRSQEVTAHCPKSYQNFRDIARDVEENEKIHEIFRVVSRFSPLHFVLYRGKSFSLVTVRSRPKYDIHNWLSIFKGDSFLIRQSLHFSPFHWTLSEHVTALRIQWSF